MNGKRVRMAVMSAVILSALAVSVVRRRETSCFFAFLSVLTKKLIFPIDNGG